MMMKKELCALGVGLSVLIAAGAAETMPVITIIMIPVMAALVKIGELWEVE
jgi:hypothetical protein